MTRTIRAVTDDSAPPGTKREAIRRALAAGLDKPREGVPWIHEQFKIRLTSHEFSMNKVAIRNQQARARERGSVSEGTIESADTPGPTSKAAELARQVKALIAQYGSSEVRAMVDVLA